MTLAASLDRIREETAGRFPPEIRLVYDRFVAGLLAHGVAAGAPDAGDPMPAFALPSADGRMVRSDALLAEGPLVVSFFRGDWCPYCETELLSHRSALPAIEAAGGRLVALTPDTAGLPLRTVRRLGLAQEILCDVDLGVAAAFGLVFVVPDEAVAMFRSFGLDLAVRHGTGAWMLPVPATFVVDRAGIVRARHVDPDFTRRMEPSDIVESLKALA